MNVDFSDLLLIRKGGPDLTMGSGPSHLEPVSSAGEWNAKREALQELYRLTLGLQPYHDVAPCVETVSEKDCGDHILRKLSYFTGPDERINAYMMIPKGMKGKVPGVLCIHPTTPFGKEQPIGNDPSANGQDRAYALHLARQGFATFAFDLVSVGERKYEGLECFDTAPFYLKHPKWSVRGKDLWDVSQALNVMASMPEIDADRLGSIGHSQGGGITIHAMAMESRIKAGVSSCGEWPYRISKNPFNAARTAWWVGRPALRPFCLTGKEFPVQMQELMAMAAPRAIMNISALNDCQYSLEEQAVPRQAFEEMTRCVKEVYRLNGVEDRFECVLHLNGHGFIEEQRKPAYAFLKRQLS